MFKKYRIYYRVIIILCALNCFTANAQSKTEKIEILNNKIFNVRHQIDSVNTLNKELARKHRISLDSLGHLLHGKREVFEKLNDDEKRYEIKIDASKTELDRLAELKNDNVMQAIIFDTTIIRSCLNFDSVSHKVYSYFSYKLGTHSYDLADRILPAPPVLYTEYNFNGSADGHFMTENNWYEVNNKIPFGQDFAYPLNLTSTSNLKVLSSDYHDNVGEYYNFLTGSNYSKEFLDGEFYVWEASGRNRWKVEDVEYEYSNDSIRLIQLGIKTSPHKDFGELQSVIVFKKGIVEKLIIFSNNAYLDSTRFLLNFKEDGVLKGLLKMEFSQSDSTQFVIRDSISFNTQKEGVDKIGGRYTPSQYNVGFDFKIDFSKALISGDDFLRSLGREENSSELLNLLKRLSIKFPLE